MVLRVALSALARNKMRTLLTTLGIIFGVAAVITNLAIGEGARRSVQDLISKRGTNSLIVFSRGPVRQGVRAASGTEWGLSPADVLAVREQCPAVTAASAMSWAEGPLVYQNKNWPAFVRGVDSEFPLIRPCPVGRGRFFTTQEVRDAERVCVLGSDTVRELFGEEDAVGKTIRIKTSPFLVVGTIIERGDTWVGGDDEVFIPYTTAMRRMSRRSSIGNAMFLARSRDDIDLAREQITRVLRDRHRLSDEAEDDFEVIHASQWVAAMDDSTRILSLLLLGVASVSLLVGGVGIMNIMLVSVTERFREIGLRMALGARGHDVLRQFLAEAFLLSLFGGILGIALGYAASSIVGRYTSWDLVISRESVLVAFSFAALVGMLSGVYPALKASRLDPIEALRHE